MFAAATMARRQKWLQDSADCCLRGACAGKCCCTKARICGCADGAQGKVNAGGHRFAGATMARREKWLHEGTHCCLRSAHAGKHGCMMGRIGCEDGAQGKGAAGACPFACAKIGPQIWGSKDRALGKVAAGQRGLLPGRRAHGVRGAGWLHGFAGAQRARAGNSECTRARFCGCAQSAQKKLDARGHVLLSAR